MSNVPAHDTKLARSDSIHRSPSRRAPRWLRYRSQPSDRSRRIVTYNFPEVLAGAARYFPASSDHSSFKRNYPYDDVDGTRHTGKPVSYAAFR